MPRVKAEFATVIHNQNGASRNFATRACGGGHGNEWRYGGGYFGRAAFDGGVGFKRTFVGGQYGNAFGAVDGRAAAQGN